MAAHIAEAVSWQQDAQFQGIRAAKHRYEKYAEPLLRSTRLVLALIDFAVWVYHNRTGKQKKRTKAWLMWLVATDWHLLLSAMLADAADECLTVLTRPNDKETAEPALTTAH